MIIFYKGPKLHNIIITILLNFRLWFVAVNAEYLSTIAEQLEYMAYKEMDYNSCLTWPAEKNFCFQAHSKNYTQRTILYVIARRHLLLPKSFTMIAYSLVFPSL